MPRDHAGIPDDAVFRHRNNRFDHL
jgi:hypothetical protein